MGPGCRGGLVRFPSSAAIDDTRPHHLTPAAHETRCTQPIGTHRLVCMATHIQNRPGCDLCRCLAPTYCRVGPTRHLTWGRPLPCLVGPPCLVSCLLVGTGVGFLVGRSVLLGWPSRGCRSPACCLPCWWSWVDCGRFWGVWWRFAGDHTGSYEEGLGCSHAIVGDAL